MKSGAYNTLRGCLCLLAAGLLPLGAMADPLACDAPVFSFGEVDASTGIVDHVFTLRNQGLPALILDDVSSPCGCVALQLATNRLAGGESTRLAVQLDLRRRRGAQKLAAHVSYHAQDDAAGADASILKLSLVGTVAGSNSVSVAMETPGLSTAPNAAHQALPATAGLRPVVVELFGESGCEACATVRREILPAARALLGDRGVIVERDVFETTNFVVLAKYQDRFGVVKNRRNDPVSIVVDGCAYLGGVDDIRRNLPGVLQQRLDAAAQSAEPEMPVESGAGDEHVAARRLAAFSVAGVALAGLLDGVNPCAFATVVFLASLLAVARVRGAGVLLMGSGFLAGAFVTYFLLGLGLFHGLRALTAWHGAARALDITMAAILMLLAFISLRDAWRFRHTGRAADVMLRMPDALRNRVHGLLRRRITPGGLAGSGLIAGILVTLLESVCTGQVYGPTLMAVARDPQLRPHAMGLLAVYNLAFLVPVMVVMIAAWRGTSSMALADWSRRNAVWGKVLMAGFFLALALVILAT